jgi:hypothetical protein
VHHIAQAAIISRHHVEGTIYLRAARDTVIDKGDDVRVPVTVKEGNFILEATPLVGGGAFLGLDL